MKKLMIACVLTTGIATFSYAQQAQKQTAPAQNKPKPPTPEETAKHRIDMLKGRLALSDGQYKSMYDAALQYEKTRDEMKKIGSAKTADYNKVDKDLNDKFHKILNAEQSKKYDEIMAKESAPPSPKKK